MNAFSLDLGPTYYDEANKPILFYSILIAALISNVMSVQPAYSSPLDD